MVDFSIGLLTLDSSLVGYEIVGCSDAASNGSSLENFLLHVVDSGNISEVGSLNLNGGASVAFGLARRAIAVLTDPFSIASSVCGVRSQLGLAGVVGDSVGVGELVDIVGVSSIA